MLSKTEIAEKSGVHIGRVKYYIQNFPEYFTEHNVDGKAHPVYETEAVDKIRLISDLIAERKSHDAIRKALETVGYSPVIDYTPENEPTANVADKRQGDIATIAQQLPGLTNSLEAVQRGLEALNRMNDELSKIIEKQEANIRQRDETIQEQANTISDREIKITDLEKQLKQLEAERDELERQLKEEKKKYGLFGSWKKNE